MPNYPHAADVEKEPTPLQKRFVKYIKEQTGYDPDVTTVVLFQKHRTPFQKSEGNRADLAKRREAAAFKAEERANTPPKPRGRPPKAKVEAEVPVRKVKKSARADGATAVSGKKVKGKPGRKPRIVVEEEED